MRFMIEDLEVFFPYPYIYPEQYEYMCKLKKIIDVKGPGVLEMPSGTGKTVSLLSLLTSYQVKYPQVKVVYCSRTVPEIEKALEELKVVINYRDNELGEEAPSFLGVGLSSRKKLCINREVNKDEERDLVDSRCRNLTANWVRQKSEERGGVGGVELCEYFEKFESEGKEKMLYGVYTLDEIKKVGKEKGWCPYFFSRNLLNFANVIIYSYQYMLNPKIYDLVSKHFKDNTVVVFDEAHNIDNVCIEGLSFQFTPLHLQMANSNIGSLNVSVEKFTHLFF